MARFIIERHVGALSDEELQEAGKRSNKVLAEMEGVVWIRSYISHAEGKIYCEYEAPSAELVAEHARLAGLPANKISEIALEISPSMFV